MAKELRIIFPTAPLSNLYLLSGIAKIAEIIRSNSANEIHIHLLLLQDVSTYPDYFKNQLVDHYRGLIKNLDEQLETVWEIQKLNFLSLFRYVVMNLVDLNISERRKVALDIVDYDIREYLAREKENIDPEGHLTSYVNDRWDQFVDSVKEVLCQPGHEHINEIYFLGEKPLMKDLLILSSFSSGNMDLCIVVIDKVKELIDYYVKDYHVNRTAIIKDFSADFLKIDRAIAFHTPCSKYINKQNSSDWTGSIKTDAILNEMGCKLFPAEGEAGENINKGFLYLQEELIKQLTLVS